MSGAVATAPDEHPSASTVAASPDVHCPLCDYNLRGLDQSQPAPRCPECGYAFDWTTLLDEHARRHPYLFEHHPRRPIGSLLRTLWVSIVRPRRFWRELRPEHTPKPRRLVGYWLILAGIAVLASAVFAAHPIVTYVQDAARGRAYMLAAFRRGYDPNGILTRFASPQAAVNSMYPPLTPAKAWQIVRGKLGTTAHLLWPVIAAYLLWPWLTVLALLIFRETMRHARIRPVHVIRCAVYSADAALLIGPLALGLSFVVGQSSTYYTMTRVYAYVLDLHPALAIALGTGLVLLTYRLCLAYARYLRFPNALGTVLLSQLIVWLAMTWAFLAVHGFF
jgi:hypothetical protein